VIEYIVNLFKCDSINCGSGRTTTYINCDHKLTLRICYFVFDGTQPHKISGLVRKIWWSGLKPRKRNTEYLWAKLWKIAVLKHSRLISNRRFHNAVCKTPYYFGNTHSKFIHLCFEKSWQKIKGPC